MMKATKQDESEVVQILSDGFLDNKSVNYVVRQDQRRLERVQSLMRYSFQTCLDFGEVWLSDDRSCCALVLFPERKGTTFSSVLRDLKLTFSVIGLSNVLRVMRREARIKKLYPAGDLIYYLWFIGVSPDKQGKGLGTQMMKKLLADAYLKDRTVFLETSTERNLPWYTAFGFEQYAELDFGYPLYCLRKAL